MRAVPQPALGLSREPPSAGQGIFSSCFDPLAPMLPPASALTPRDGGRRYPEVVGIGDLLIEHRKLIVFDFFSSCQSQTGTVETDLDDRLSNGLIVGLQDVSPCSAEPQSKSMRWRSAICRVRRFGLAPTSKPPNTLKNDQDLSAGALHIAPIALT